MKLATDFLQSDLAKDMGTSTRALLTERLAALDAATADRTYSDEELATIRAYNVAHATFHAAAYRPGCSLQSLTALDHAAWDFAHAAIALGR